MACRDVKKCNAAAEQVRIRCAELCEANQMAKCPVQVEPMQLDLSSTETIDSFVEQFNSKFRKVF